MQIYLSINVKSFRGRGEVIKRLHMIIRGRVHQKIALSYERGQVGSIVAYEKNQRYLVFQ